MLVNWRSSKDIGERVRAIRKQLGVSQAVFAKKCGLSEASQGDIGRIERGKLWPDGKPNARLLLRIAELGGVELDHFRLVEPDLQADQQKRTVIADWLEAQLKILRGPPTVPDEDGPHSDAALLAGELAELEGASEKKQGAPSKPPRQPRRPPARGAGGAGE